MRRKSLNVIAVVSVLFLFSCVQEEDMTRQILESAIKVEIGNFAPSAGTRTPVEDGYTTVFKGGEQIGITAVKDGVVYNGMDNVPFTYDANSGGSWTCTNANSATNGHLYYYSDVTYIAYYPYDAAMTGKVSEDAIIAAFTPKADQSTYAGYTASDLMTSTGNVTGGSGSYALTFNLQHRMLMLVASVRTKYFMTSTTNGYNYFSMIDYPVKNMNTGNFVIDGTDYPFCTIGNGSYRLLLKPEEAEKSIGFNFQLVEGQQHYAYADPTPIKMEQGKYHSYTIATPKDTPALRQVCAGDFYYNNGNILPYDAVEEGGGEIPNKADCIGIVFYAGAGPGDAFSSYSDTGISGDIHGYVVALHDAYNGDRKWGRRETSFTFGQETQFNGYSKKAFTNKSGPLYAVSAEIRNYQQKVAVPASASPWYLPAYAQLGAIWNVYRHSETGVVYRSLIKAGGDLFAADNYWSVTEITYHDVTLLNMQNGGRSTSGKCSGYDMGWNWGAYSGTHLARVILTF